MEKKYVHSTDGQEIRQDDINLMSSTGASALDRVLADLLRLVPYDGTNSTTAILPFGINGPRNAIANPSPLGTVSPGSGGHVKVNPFRAIVGSRSNADVETNWRDIRSAVWSGGNELAIANTVSNHRWDLVYATLITDGVGLETLFIKDVTSDNVSAKNVKTFEQDVVIVQVEQGIEGPTPARPALPVPSDSDHFNIPLAYVMLHHAYTGGLIDEKQIHEVAPVITLANAVGAQSLRVASGQYKAGGFGDNWDPSTGSAGTRAKTFMPPVLSGGTELLLAFDFFASPIAPALGASTIIDDTIDWRKRMFRFQATAAAATDFCWDAVTGSGFPGYLSGYNANPSKCDGWGQSFFDDGTSNIGTIGGVVAKLTNSQMSVMGIGSEVDIYVHLSTGNLMAKVSGTSPACKMFFWLEATAPFGNDR